MTINIRTLRFLALPMAFALMAGNAQAQIATTDEVTEMTFVPKCMSSNVQAKLVTLCPEGENENAKLNVTVYSPDFEQEKTFSIKARVTSTGNDGTTYEDIYDSWWTAVNSFHFYNLDEDQYYSSEDLFVTQTLFNDDDKYEYVRSKFKAVAAENGGTEYATVGFEVVQDDGTVVLSIDYEESEDYDTWWFIVKLNGEMYWFTVQSYYHRGRYSYCIYKIDKTASSVKKVKTLSGIKIAPRVVGKSHPVNIAFSHEAGEGTTVVVTALDGKVVAKRNVDAGETSIDISTARMTSGLYNFTVFSKGKVVENGKVIVK